MEYEYSVKYIHFFFPQYVNKIITLIVKIIEYIMGSYPELLCLRSFYIKKAGSVLLSMFFKPNLLPWAALMQA